MNAQHTNDLDLNEGEMNGTLNTGAFSMNASAPGSSRSENGTNQSDGGDAGDDTGNGGGNSARERARADHFNDRDGSSGSGGNRVRH